MPWVLLGAAAAGLFVWASGGDAPTLLHPGLHSFRFGNGSTPANQLSLNITFGAGNVHDLGGGVYAVSVLTEKQVLMATIPGATLIA